MALPANPYCTSAQVAVMMQATLHGLADFDDIETVPTKSAVDTAIGLVSGHIDMRLQMAGYVVPLAVIDGESWPSHQTSYLSFLAALGAVSTVGYMSVPFPHDDYTGRNIFQRLYEEELNAIYIFGRLPGSGGTQSRLRASYYANSPVSLNLKQPRGPQTDFMTGRIDPSVFLDTYSIADRYYQAMKHVEDFRWDYFWGAFDIEVGIGTLYGES